jgi:predicted nucleotidyltransferase
VQQKQPEFGTILRALGEHNVRFVLIGGLAMVIRGSAHVTEDIDVAFVRDRLNVQAVVRALAPFHPRPRGFPESLPFKWDEQAVRSATILTLDTDAGIVDLLAETAEGLSFEDIWARSDSIDAFGVTIRVASIEDLIVMKRAANRLKDQLHVLELEALKKLLAGESSGVDSIGN